MNAIIKNDINYGNLVQVTMDGVVIVGSHDYFRFYIFKNSDFVFEPYEDHYCELTIELETPMQPHFYARCHEDVVKVAKKLSKSHPARIQAMARILARYEKGELVGDVRSLEDFYTGLTPAEIASHRLIQ